MSGKAEVDIDDLMKWVLQDPDKVRRIIAAEKLVDKFGSIEIIYHDGKTGSITAKHAHQC